MEIFVEIRGASRVLFFSGRLDEIVADRFRAVLESWADRLIDQGAKRIIVDFSGVQFIDSTILRSSLTIAKRFSRHGASLVLTNLSEEVAATLRVSGIQKMLENSGTISIETDLPPPMPPPPAGRVDLVQVIAGDLAIECKEGDTLGSEGSLSPEIFEGIPDVGPQVFSFHKQDGNWILRVAEHLSGPAIFDYTVLSPGQSVSLTGLHLVQISLLRVFVRAVLSSNDLIQDERVVNDQMEIVFSKTAEWLGRAVSE